MTDFLADLLDSDLDAEPVARAVPVYKTATERFEEGCPKCNGRGKFISYSGRVVGDCFACKGKGTKTFKTSAATRASARNAATERKERITMEGIEAWKAANPAEFAWLEKTALRWDVAASLLDGLRKYGSLTEKQMALVARGIERDAAKTKPVETVAVDTAGIDRLKESFDRAVAYSAEKGLKLSPRITIGGLTISPAKATSANPGALYVKQSGGERAYLGKVANGRFYAVAACSKEDEGKVISFIANPAEAAKVYGQTTGTCCVCNATLRSDWKHKGIGPICAEKFGW
jgi:hypothetical protein